MKNQVRHTRSGWILLETLVALTVLCIAIVGVNRALGQAMLTKAQARDYTTARFLLDGLVSDLEMRPDTFEDDEGESGDFGDEHPRFSWEWTVTEMDAPAPEVPPELINFLGDGELELPAKALGKVSVTVRWTLADQPYEETVETLLSGARMKKEDEEGLGNDPFADET